MDWKRYEHLSMSYPSDGVLLITLNRPEALNAMNPRMHTELCDVWHDVERDDDTRAVVLTGAGRAFSAGGDLAMFEDALGNYEVVHQLLDEASGIVLNISDCSKPVVSAINGVAVGAGLAAALTADISVMASSARLSDGHITIGVAAGDHAAFIWPMLCSLAKARYYLMTADFIGGEEAERIGLVTHCVPDDEVLDRALAIGAKLAAGPRDAIATTKRTLNYWARAATPMFESALARELLGFFSDDAKEGLAALKEKRSPDFPSNRRGSARLSLVDVAAPVEEGQRSI